MIMNANGLNKDDVSTPKNDFKHDAKSELKDVKSEAKSEAKDVAADLKSEVKDAAKKIKRVRDEVMHGMDIKKVLEAGKSLGETIQETVTTQPYAAVGVAAVAGFGIGCILGSKIGRIALGIGVTVAARKILEEVDYKALINKAFAV
jgi:ElaB/YqjD/DUF883 family membrane-anchored ribosome-binding protein